MISNHLYVKLAYICANRNKLLNISLHFNITPPSDEDSSWVIDAPLSAQVRMGTTPSMSNRGLLPNFPPAPVLHSMSKFDVISPRGLTRSSRNDAVISEDSNIGRLCVVNCCLQWHTRRKQQILRNHSLDLIWPNAMDA